MADANVRYQKIKPNSETDATVRYRKVTPDPASDTDVRYQKIKTTPTVTFTADTTPKAKGYYPQPDSVTLRNMAKKKAVYGSTDVSGLTYQTVGEYDAKISELAKLAKATQPSADGKGQVDRALAEKWEKTDQEIQRLKAERTLLERATYIDNTYGNLKSNPDFGEKSNHIVDTSLNNTMGAAANLKDYMGNSAATDHTGHYGWVDGGWVTDDRAKELATKYGWNAMETANRIAAAVSGQQEESQKIGEVSRTRTLEELKWLTPDELRNYNYLYNTAGEEAANTYLQDMKIILQRRNTAATEFKTAETYDNAGTAGKIAMNVLSVPAKIVGAPVAAVNDLYEAATGQYSPYGGAHALTTYADTVRGETAQDIYSGVVNSGGGDVVAQLVSTLYQGGMSGMDSLVGGVALGSGYLAVAAADAATHKARELYESGADGWQIAAGAAASGIIEAAMEKVPLENLLETPANIKNWRDVFKAALVQTGMEGGEEFLTEIANTTADSLLQGANSDLSNSIAAYQKQGYTESQARQMAARDKALDVLWATVGGMAGGFGSSVSMGTVGLAQNHHEITRVGKAVLQQEGGLEQAVSAGLNNAPFTEAYHTAQKIQAAVENGKGDTVSAYEIGKMLLESQSEEAVAARERYQATIDSAKAVGVDENQAKTAATAAARTGRYIEFVDATQLQISDTDGQFAVATLPNGQKYVHVDVDQSLFDGLTDKEKLQMAELVIRERFKGKVIGSKEKPAYVSKATAKEYGHPAKPLRDTSIIDAKARLSPELNHALEAAFDWNNTEDGESGHTHHDAIGGFDHATVLFEVGNTLYRGTVNVKIIEQGRLLTDITKIEKATEGDYRSSENNSPSVSNGGLSSTTVSQNSLGVNTHSMQGGTEYTQNGVALGKYTADGRILLSNQITDEETLQFILKHELAHSIEGTAAWDAILKEAKRQMGREAWEQKVAETAQERQAQGDVGGAATPEREAVADWIGLNLYKEDFAAALARNDRKAANVFVQVMDKMRLAFAGSGNRGAAARITALERMYLNALESEGGSEGDGQFAVNYKKNTLVKKGRSWYDEFASLAMQWARSNTTKPGDSTTIFDNRRNYYVRIRATRDGFVEEKTYTKEAYNRYYEYTRKHSRQFDNSGSEVWYDDGRNDSYALRPRDRTSDGQNDQFFNDEQLPEGKAYDRPRNIEIDSRGERTSLTYPPQSNTDATESSSTVSDTDTEAGFAISENGSYSFLPPELAERQRAQMQEQATVAEQAVDTDTLHRTAVERAISGEHTATASQAQTIEKLQAEIGEEELHRRMFMAEQMFRPSGTIDVDGQEVNTDAYIRAVEELLPTDEVSLERFIHDVEARSAEETAKAYAEGRLDDAVSLPINLQLFAARCKLEWTQITQNEGGKEARQFYEKRAAGMDANHHQEFVDRLAQRSETYNPIANQKTLDRANEKLRNSEWKAKLEKRLYNYHSGQPTFSALEGAAIQVMINDALNDGDYDKAVSMVTQYSRCGTDAGRAVQIMSLMRRLTPEGTIKAAVREFRKAENKVMGEHTDESLDVLAETVTDAVSRLKASRVQGAQGAENKGSQRDTVQSNPSASQQYENGDPVNPLTNEELEDALVNNIRQNGDPYITEDEVRGIIHRAIENATDIPAHLKKMLLKDETTADLAERIAKVVENGHLNENTTRRAFAEALGLPSLSAEDAAQLTELVNRMNGLESGTLEHQEAMEDIYRFVGERIPVTGWETWQAWRKLAMLGNPKTHIRNFTSNVVMYGAVHQADTAVAAALERLLIKDPAKRTTLLGWSRTEHGQKIQGAVNKAAERALVQMRRGGGKYDIASSKLAGYKKYFGTTKAGEALNKVSDFNSEWLEKGDALTFVPAFKQALGQIMTVRGMTEVTEEVFQTAYDQAADVTFRAENALATWINNLKGKGGLLGTMADIAIPFTKTPANIAVQMAQHSPVGLVKGAYDLVQSVRGAKNAKTAAEAINTLAKGITGSALLAIGLLLGSAGLFNTKYGKTEKERAADELAGVQENALIFGGWSLTLDWLQPAAAPLVIGASIAQRLQEDGIGVETVFGAVMDGTDSLFELTMLQSLYDILGGYDAGVSSSLASVAENAISQSVPTLLGQAARSIDPVQRRPSGEGPVGGKFGKYLNQVLAKIPGLTYLLEPELDVWGDDVYRTGKADTAGGWLNFFQQVLLPTNVKRATADDNITMMLLNLYENAEEKGSYALPSAPSRDDATEMDMLYAEMARTVGKAQRAAVEDLVGDDQMYNVQVSLPSGRTKQVKKRWSQMSESERLRVLNRVYSNVKDGVKDPEDDYYMQLLKGVQ